jgi:short-subunit dehydrogenase
MKPLLTRVARDVSGKVVLLTGAANGIGAEGACQLTARGARVRSVARQDTA